MLARRLAPVVVATPILITALPLLSQERLSFEVASVKRNVSGESGQSVRLGPGDTATLRNVSALTMLQVAYDLSSFDVIDAPSWTRRERFDVTGKAASQASRDQFRAMLRALLEERFRLVAQTSETAAPAYSLVLAREDGKLGPKLKAVDFDCAQATPEERRGQTGLACNLRVGLARLSARGFTLDVLAGHLTPRLGRQVINATGLGGLFEWDLEFLPEGMPVERFRTPTYEPAPLITSLNEQLGLRLESREGRRQQLVIERLEHPSPD